VAAWATSSSKVPLSSAGLAWSLDHQGVLASGGPEGELVEGDDLSLKKTNSAQALSNWLA